MLAPNFTAPTLQSRGSLSVSQLRAPEIRKELCEEMSPANLACNTCSSERAAYKYKGQWANYEAPDSGKWAHSVAFAQRGGDPAHNTLPWLPDESTHRAPGPARDWSKSSTFYQGRYLTDNKWCANIYVQANVK